MKEDENGIYQKLVDENSDMEMFHEQSLWEESKPILIAFGFVILVVMPWCIGAAMLAKWLIF